MHCSIIIMHNTQQISQIFIGSNIYFKWPSQVLHPFIFFEFLQILGDRTALQSFDVNYLSLSNIICLRLQKFSIRFKSG